MRKAFDANVSRAKPRLRLGTLASTARDLQQEGMEEGEESGELVETLSETGDSAMEPSGEASAADEQPEAEYAEQEEMESAPVRARTQRQVVREAAREGRSAQQSGRVAQQLQQQAVVPVKSAPKPAAPSAVSRSAEETFAQAVVQQQPVARPASYSIPQATVSTPNAPVYEQAEIEPAGETLDPRERRERLRARLKAATAKVEPAQPTPQNPAEARSSALALVAQLRQELDDALKLNASLSKDLEQARADFARAADEARTRTAEAARMSIEVAERAKLIEELGKEMSSLETERDDTLVELRSARAELEKEAALRKELDDKLLERDAELAETLTEEERLAAELEDRNAELRRIQLAMAGLTEERDRLAKQVAEISKERSDLLDSQKALDEIHRALAEARARFGARG